MERERVKVEGVCGPVAWDDRHRLTLVYGAWKKDMEQVNQVMTKLELSHDR